IRVFLKGTDAEITPAGDKLIAAYTNAISAGYPMVFKYSAYGKQNVDIDFSATVPMDWTADKKQMPLDIHLDKCDFTNQINNFHMAFVVTNAYKNASESARVSFKLEEDFSEQYDALLQEMIQTFIKQAFANPANAQTPGIANFIQKHTPEETYAIIYP